MLDLFNRTANVWRGKSRRQWWRQTGRVENSAWWDAVPRVAGRCSRRITTTTTTTTTLPAAVSDREGDSFTYLKPLLTCFLAPRFLAATGGGLRNIECLLREKIDPVPTFLARTELRSLLPTFTYQHVAASWRTSCVYELKIYYSRYFTVGLRAYSGHPREKMPKLYAIGTWNVISWNIREKTVDDNGSRAIPCAIREIRRSATM